MQHEDAASFDLFGRYWPVRAYRQRHLGPAPVRILDVGDPVGIIAGLFPDDHTVSVDVYEDGPPLTADHQALIASGFDLPYRSGSFDLVGSHDVLEHLPPATRTDFVGELLRVSRGPVVLVAPFDDPRTVRCEQIVNAQFATRLGSSLAALDEHAEFGLPALDEVTAWLKQHDIDHAVYGGGWIYHWLAFYLVKAALVGLGAASDHAAFDASVNRLLQEADAQGPHYRRVLVLRPAGPLDLPALVPAEPSVAADVDRLTELGLALSAALPVGEDPFAAGSAARAWIHAHLETGGPVGDVARSLLTAFDAVRPAPRHLASPDAEPARRVSVVLVNLNGAAFIRDCLDSLTEQDYPRDLTEVIVVDNGSTDGSLDLLASEYPWVKVLPQGRNTGFAAAVTTGVEAATGDCVALINNDMRADPSWLRELVAAFAPEDGYACVAGQILSWDGTTLDFGGGAVSFNGMAHQIGFGRPIGMTDVEDGQDLLFACGGSMLVSRDVYLELGGFDPGFFAYFEDVDFGWRAWLFGYRVRLAAKAKTYHRLHGTSSRFPEHQLMVLYERNALRMVLKNYDEAHLARALGPALLLLVKRTLIRGELDGAAFELGGDNATSESVPRTALANLHAVGQVIDDFEALMAERTRIQLARVRGDEEVLALFHRPYEPSLLEPEYLDAQRRVLAGLELGPALEKARAGRLLIVGNGEDRARAIDLARALAGSVAVTVTGPAAPELEDEWVEFVDYADGSALRRLAHEADVLIAPVSVLRDHADLVGLPAVVIADLAQSVDAPTSAPDARRQVVVIDHVLEGADFFICASERERADWLGRLAALDRPDAALRAVDPSGRDLIDVVPTQLPPSGSWRQAVRPIRRVIEEPWRWHAQRAARFRSRSAGGSAALLRAERELRAAMTIERTSRREEVAALRKHIAELEEVIAHQNKRLALIRGSFLMPAYRRAKSFWRK